MDCFRDRPPKGYYNRTMADQHETQWIARLTPLDEVLARITEVVGPVEPRALGVAAARRRVLAEDVVGGPCPAAAIALRDGWAVEFRADHRCRCLRSCATAGGGPDRRRRAASGRCRFGRAVRCGDGPRRPLRGAGAGDAGRRRACGGGRYPRRLDPAPRRRATARYRCRGAFLRRTGAGDGA